MVNGNGNVGINTNSPTQKLDVRGSVRIDEWIYDENNENKDTFENIFPYIK